MALETASISSKIKRPNNASRLPIKVTIQAVADHATVKDTATGDVIAGQWTATSQNDGTLTIPDLPKLPQTGIDPPDARWRATFELVNKPKHSTERAPRAIEFQLTADTTWGALIDVSGTPVSETLLSLVTDARDDTLAARDQAQAVAASVQREQASGVAGLTSAGKIYESRVPDRLSDAALSATYVPHTLARPGNRWVSLGDSITAGSFDNANGAMGEAWPLYAMLGSQGRLRLVYNAGVPGNTSAQMLARFDTDVTPYAPNIVTLLAGTNDIGTGVSFATYQANIKAIVAKIRALGAAPVLATIPPRDAGGYGPTIVKWNAWIRDYAERNGISVMDFYRVFTDPTNGHYLPAYYNDGIHPNFAGAAALGDVASWVLSPLAPVGAPLLPIDSTDTNNLVGAPGLFLTAAGNGVGTDWSPGSAPTGVTKSVVADAGIIGNFQKIVMAGASGLWAQTLSIASGFAVGDTVRIVGVLNSDGGTGVAADVKLSFTGASKSIKPAASLSQPITRGVFCQTAVVPAGTTALQVQLQCGAAGATGTVQFGQIGVYNLTTMGLSA